MTQITFLSEHNRFFKESDVATWELENKSAQSTFLPLPDGLYWCSIQVRRLGAELDTSTFSLKAKNRYRTRLASLVQKVRMCNIIMYMKTGDGYVYMASSSLPQRYV